MTAPHVPRSGLVHRQLGRSPTSQATGIPCRSARCGCAESDGSESLIGVHKGHWFFGVQFYLRGQHLILTLPGPPILAESGGAGVGDFDEIHRPRGKQPEHPASPAQNQQNTCNNSMEHTRTHTHTHKADLHSSSRHAASSQAMNSIFLSGPSGPVRLAFLLCVLDVLAQTLDCLAIFCRFLFTFRIIYKSR